MVGYYQKYRFLILRRITQIGILFLYFSANMYGFTFLQGNLSSSLLLGTVPLVDPFALLQIFATGVMVAMDAILGAVIIVLFYMVIGGRAFCSWVCPLNMVTDCANGLRRMFTLDKVERKIWLSKNVRYWVIALTLILCSLTGVSAFEMVSPIGILHRGVIFGMGMGYAAILSIFLFDLFAVKNGWCGHLCPVGGFYAALGSYSLLRVQHDQPNCTLCMKCKDVCPEKQVLAIIGKTSGSITMGECTNCGRCVEVCDDNALSFGVRSYINKNG